MKRPMLKRYITIQLDTNELAKREKVKLAFVGKGKLSDRKIYMAMVDALGPTEISTVGELETVEEE